ncbi:3-hydroxyacyl-CoA dehydrogenase family protein [Couchioplanes azureus]|uniref:3-hydroxyacyl-CoA dehydrogenase family protein n=1 Tax=Couchioplanes caeruleus TaxID=56438 RepID=UPI0019B50638|nr:3-hydroxyacyl-CoA dehydrogenase family protein [Couchioplanes caeruleus]GGQ61726.1 3-hydroxybutyryl-CoA dehydrogenase [Couchioplanes caeruleus subsp. azureus]
MTGGGAAMGVPKRVGVVGGGRMGAGIAQVFAAAGAVVTVVERDETAAVAARERVATGLRRAAERGKLGEEPSAVLERIELAGELPADAELVVEAVPEDARLKAGVLTAAEALVGDGAVLATNTSSLSIAGLAEGLRRPERFVGMHFFNPVPASDLVEIVVGPQTTDAVRDAASSWAAALGKTAIVVRDSPGFATSRLGVLLGLEAIRMLEEGVADAASIDRAMELGYRHPMGPLRSTDLVGLDVRLAIAEHLHRELGDRFAPPRLLREKVARGELGRKSGQGFYEWASGSSGEGR